MTSLPACPWRLPLPKKLMQHRKSLNQSMLEHARLQQRSGQTIASYAKQIGISRHKMQYWVSKYNARQKTQKAESDSSLKFIDLGSFGIQDQPVDESSQAETLATTAVSSKQDDRLPQMTLSFPNGMCLKIY
jgi:L-lactate utilization protein LutB